MVKEGYSDYKKIRKRCLSKEPLTEWFFVEPKMVLLVTNPVHALLFAHHQMSSSLYIASHATKTFTSLQTTVPMIHCTDCTHTAECTEYTYTAESIQTRFISLGLPLSDRRVLSSVYHSSSDSYTTEPFHISSPSF